MSLIKHGLISGRKEVTVGVSDTTFAWDTAFTKTYKDSNGVLVPSYYFGIKSSDSECSIVSQTLTQIVLKAAVDNTVVKFEAFE